MSQNIVPSLWSSEDPELMVGYYEHVFGEVSRQNTSYYPEQGLLDFQQDMAGKVLTIEFTLLGLSMIVINGGPFFAPNPSISFMVRFSPKQHSDPSSALTQTWERLVSEGTTLMPLDSYPFSQQYGWVQDKFGVSWQLILDADEDPSDNAQVLSVRPQIIPVLMFSGPAANQAEAALNRYLDVFPNSRIGSISRYPEAQGTATKDSIAYGDCLLNDQWIGFMDSGTTDFTFNEAISLIVNCETQSEIDHYWDALSRVPESEQCGWCKDEFGVSWQITPVNMEELSSHPDAYAAMMQMKKIDIEVLRAFN